MAGGTQKGHCPNPGEGGPSICQHQYLDGKLQIRCFPKRETLQGGEPCGRSVSSQRVSRALLSVGVEALFEAELPAPCSA